MKIRYFLKKYLNFNDLIIKIVLRTQRPLQIEKLTNHQGDEQKIYSSAIDGTSHLLFIMALKLYLSYQPPLQIIKVNWSQIVPVIRWSQEK